MAFKGKDSVCIKWLPRSNKPILKDLLSLESITVKKTIIREKTIKFMPVNLVLKFLYLITARNLLFLL